MSDDFAGLYTNFRRPSIAPEKLLRAMLLLREEVLPRLERLRVRLERA
jgi:hypothetical protein